MKKLFCLAVIMAILSGCDNKPLSDAQQAFAANCLKDVEWFMRDDSVWNSDPHKYRQEYGKYCDCVARKLSDSVAANGTFHFGIDNLLSELNQCGADIYLK